MNNLHKIGGVTALIEAAIYVVGIIVFLLILDFPSVVDPVEKVALLVDNQAAMYAVILLIYELFGIFLVVLALALHARLKDRSRALMQAATAFGLIWAGAVIASGMIYKIGIGTVVDLYSTNPTQAVTVWLALEVVQGGLGGGSEILGGLWVLLISWAALRSGGLPKLLNYLGLIVGLAGIFSTIPTLGELGGIFGLVQIVWFIWVGVVMLRDAPTGAVDSIDLFPATTHT